MDRTQGHRHGEDAAGNRDADRLQQQPRIKLETMKHAHLLFTLFLLVPLAYSRAADAEKQNPNVAFVLFDDLG
jgi:hypothetical protein